MEEPGEHTLAYWSQQMRMLKVRVERLDYEYKVQYDAAVELTKRVSLLENQHKDDMAKIGELEHKHEAMKAWILERDKKNGHANDNTRTSASAQGAAPKRTNTQPRLSGGDGPQNSH